MAATSIEFGYYPHELDFTFNDLKVQTLCSLSDKIEVVRSSEWVESDWLYAPSPENRPYPSRIFGLQKTHVLVGQGLHREEELHFYIWMLSFFAGMRFSYSAMGFLDSTPIVRGKLVDFILAGHGVEKAFEKATLFWRSNSADRQSIHLVIAALNSMYFAQNPKNLQFEEFNYLYFALDACFKLTSKIHGPVAKLCHAKRVEWTCQKLGTIVPAWATGSPTTISDLRNAAIHEALFAGASSQNLCLEIRKLICRFLVSLLLGCKSDYVSSCVDDRMQRLLII
jgi:hypothetical protein